MDNNVYWIYAGVLVFLLLILIGGVLSKHTARKMEYRVAMEQIKQPKPEPLTSRTQPRKQKTRHEEVIDSLDWMLQNGIIDIKEYNNLVVKSLPYF